MCAGLRLGRNELESTHERVARFRVTRNTEQPAKSSTIESWHPNLSYHKSLRGDLATTSSSTSRERSSLIITDIWRHSHLDAYYGEDCVVRTDSVEGQEAEIEQGSAELP